MTCKKIWLYLIENGQIKCIDDGKNDNDTHTGHNGAN